MNNSAAAAVCLAVLFSTPSFLHHECCAATVELPRTGQTLCYQGGGQLMSCAGSGQDGEWRAGKAWSGSRFIVGSVCIVDGLTGLIWTKESFNLAGLQSWQGALDFVVTLNSGGGTCGRTDWRLPNRTELMSLLDRSRTDPALPVGHPFGDVPSTPYWSSSTFAGAVSRAWRVDMYRGAVGDAAKTTAGCVWPVSGETSPSATLKLPETGQDISYLMGDDGALQKGVAWPSPRFADPGDGQVTDNLTGLVWGRNANLMASRDSTFDPLASSGLVPWQRALDYLKKLNSESYLGFRDWRLPNPAELESLVDLSRASPALPAAHPFTNVQNNGYWTSGSYRFEASKAWTVQMGEGSLDAGQKDAAFVTEPVAAVFHVWPVRAGYLDTDNDGVQNSLDGDDDNDGVPDSTDIFPLDASESLDSDGDGLGDNEEIRLGTNRFLRDSDGDGCNDYREVELQSNPLSAASQPRVKVAGGEYYASLLPAGYFAPSGAVLLAQVFISADPLTIEKILTFKGGYNGGYAALTGYTTVKGLTVKTGSLTVDRLAIQ